MMKPINQMSLDEMGATLQAIAERLELMLRFPDNPPLKRQAMEHALRDCRDAGGLMRDAFTRQN